jgi:hypothetical protein
MTTTGNGQSEELQQLVNLLGRADIVDAQAILVQEYTNCRDLAEAIHAEGLSPEHTYQLVDRTVNSLVWGVGIDEQIDAVPIIARSAAQNHQQGADRALALYQSDNKADQMEGSFRLLDHVLKRKLSVAFTQALYAQGVFVPDDSSFVEEYLVRSQGTESFQLRDRTIKPDLDGNYFRDSELVDRATSILAWSKKFPGLLPATWDEWQEPVWDLKQTSEAELDLPDDLTNALAEHPNFGVRVRLLNSQIVTAEQLQRAYELFSEEDLRDINVSSIVKSQYKLRIRRAGFSKDEALEAIRPFEEFLGIQLDLSDWASDQAVERAFHNTRADGVIAVDLRVKDPDAVADRMQILYAALDS